MDDTKIEPFTNPTPPDSSRAPIHPAPYPPPPTPTALREDAAEVVHAIGISGPAFVPAKGRHWSRFPALQKRSHAYNGARSSSSGGPRSSRSREGARDVSQRCLPGSSPHPSLLRPFSFLRIVWRAHLDPPLERGNRGRRIEQKKMGLRPRASCRRAAEESPPPFAFLACLLTCFCTARHALHFSSTERKKVGNNFTSEKNGFQNAEMLRAFFGSPTHWPVCKFRLFYENATLLEIPTFLQKSNSSRIPTLLGIPTLLQIRLF
ncbi:hypothetical protein CDAR_524751 [Caerostris darwini]|uniref:Uncharacterized protein n=1 Tax=Caerostris darwini TaxID=1538125 RepID=A0AAV4QX85_9ARAC|nr:hypothetical protein CDAR_524751 [Caerostris darwini]